MANILDVPIVLVENLMLDMSSDFYQFFKKGVDMCDYAIDLKLFELARTGDMKALEKFEERKRIRKRRATV